MFTYPIWLVATVLLILKVVGALSISGWWIALLYVLPFIIGLCILALAAYYGKKWVEAFVNDEQGSGVTPLENTPEQLVKIQNARNKLIN